METQQPEEATGNLLHNMILFGRLLRALGLDVDPGRMIDLIRALDHIEIGRKKDFYHTAKSLFVRRKEDIPLFDQAFELFWRKPLQDWAELDLSTIAQKRKPDKPIMTPPPLEADSEGKNKENGPSSEEEDAPPIIQTTLTYSSRERLRQKDFAEMAGEELEQIKRMMASLIWKLGFRLTRRKKPGPGALLDFRRTIRKNLKYGGEIIQWARRVPKSKPRPLVLIADISGSMERYTRLLLHFIYSLAEGLEQEVESFVFSTRLTRITRQLRDRDVDQALKSVSNTVADWSGGTKIGESLKSFNFKWARRVLGRGAVVILISDGWDRGDPVLLRREIARLQRSCHRLIWLNPLLGSPEYEPLTRGIRTALPYIDDFLPVHNLASLQDLAEHLEKLDERRIKRRQQPLILDPPPPST